MIKIEFEGISQECKDVDSNWIFSQWKNRKKVGKSCWIKIIIEDITNDIDMILTTGDYPPVHSRNIRKPNPHEKRIFDLWRRLKLNDKEYNISSIIEFINKVAAYM